MPKSEIKEEILNEACRKSNKIGWNVNIVEEAIRKAFIGGENAKK